MQMVLAPLQAALYERLRLDPALVQRGYLVFDEPPESATQYLVIGDGIGGTKRGTFGRAGEEGTEMIHLWIAQASGLTARQDAELVRAALEDTPLSIDGLTVARLKLEFTETLKERGRTPDDPSWRHVPMRFRYWIREGTE